MDYWKNIVDLNLPMETWINVNGYESIYMVSDLGRVKRLKGKNCCSDRILRQNISTTGRLMVVLSKNANKIQASVHRLVALNFLKNSTKLPIVLHIDDNPKNNCVLNLKWGTQSENISECHKKGRASNNLPKLIGENHPMFGKHVSHDSKKKMSNSKKKISDKSLYEAIELRKKGKSVKEISEIYGMSRCYMTSLLTWNSKRF